MQRFRVYTEARSNVEAIAAEYFPSFTLLSGLGHWNGQTEASSIVEVMTDDETRVNSLAQRLKTENNQQAVLITAEKIKEKLI